MNSKSLLALILGFFISITVWADDAALEVSNQQMLDLFRALKTRPLTKADEAMFNSFHQSMHKILYAQLDGEASRFEATVDQYLMSEYSLSNFVRELKAKKEFFSDSQISEADKFAYHYRCVIRLKYFHDDRRMLDKTENYLKLRRTALSLLRWQAQSLGFELNL